MHKIKAGVVGVGRMGEYHLGVLSELAEVKVVGIADVNEARAEAMGKKYNVPVYANFTDLVGKIDVAVVAVPTSLHHPVAKELLKQNIHVLLEKPCSNNLADARELFQIADKRKLNLHIGHVERFNGAVQELHKIVKDPLFVECKRMSPFSDRIKDDGVVLDVMIHDIDIVVNLINSRVTRKNVVGLSVFTDRDDIVNAQLQFENGCIANILASRASQNKVRTLSITQKDAYVILDYTEQEIFVHRMSSSQNEMDKGFLRYKQESLVERIFVHKDNPLKLEIKHFLDCARNGSPRRVATDAELYSLEIALDILNLFNQQKAQPRRKTQAG
jgi:predicted dehydrogenase